MDPTYPLLPVAYIVSATLLLFVLVTSAIRQAWNLGVCVLSVLLCLLNFAQGVNAIIWSDNANIHVFVWCDIGVLYLSNSHVMN